MATQHDLYCDETHASRQRCNRALAPAAPIEVPPPEPTFEPDRPTEVAPEPAASVLTREAVAAGIMPSPSPYVTRAWEETARAVGPLPEPTRTSAPEPTIELRSRIPSPVVVIGALCAMIVLAIILRRSPARSDGVAIGESLLPDRDGNDDPEQPAITNS